MNGPCTGPGKGIGIGTCDDASGSDIGIGGRKLRGPAAGAAINEGGGNGAGGGSRAAASEARILLCLFF